MIVLRDLYDFLDVILVWIKACGMSVKFRSTDSKSIVRELCTTLNQQEMGA